jgi:protein-disulfide isomerase
MIKKVVLGGFLFLLLAFVGLHFYFFFAAKAAFQEAKNESSALVLGNPQGGLLVVSFVDYQCPHCPALDRVLEKTLPEDPDVKLFVRPVSWMGKTSEEVAALVLGSRAQGKAAALHKRIMEEPTPPSYARAKELALELGIDVQKAEAVATASHLRSLIQKNSAIVVDIGLRSVPSLLIGPVPYAPPPEGMPGINQLRLLFEEARSKQSVTPSHSSE